ncbi:MAG: DUF2227 family putative metal-binding protein [Halobacteriovoraceae bacterium]|nr:DUF2227 family putative metal-binding protein [Halobacteriovoraceae bacterium]
MANGKTHDKFSLFIGAICTGILLGLERSINLVLAFTAGWLFATLIFSPDTDVMPKKRTHVLRFILYPYSIMFKHRGISHMIFWGTLSRILYGVVFFGVMTFILNKMGYIEQSAEKYMASLWKFLKNFDYSEEKYKLIVWPYIGMLLADLCHIFLDQITDFRNRFLRKMRF